MMKSRILIVSAILFSACTGQETELQEFSDNDIPSSKIINSCEDASDDGVIVRLASAEDGQRLMEDGRYDITPVFPKTAGKEDVEKRYGLDKWYNVKVRDTDAETLAKTLSEEESVERIEFSVRYDRPYEISEAFEADLLTRSDVPSEPVTMNDPLFKNQWFLYNYSNPIFGTTNRTGTDVSIRDAWRLEAGDPRIIVAIVDEGVKYTHPDLEANMWTNEAEKNGTEGVDDDNNGYTDDIHGYNFLADGPVSWGLYGDIGHGTHVAGLVAAVNNNGTGISSVAGGSGKGDGVRLMSCQVFSGNTKDNISAYAAAIKYAADNGASVLQCSWGEPSGRYASDAAFEQGLSVIKDALDYFMDPDNANCAAVDRNMVIFSAGNDGEAMAAYPGAYRDYICVSATSQDNLPAWYTNYGKGVNIAAPGGDNTFNITMLSTVPSESDEAKGDYAFMHGTSMATPVVSGIVALGMSYALKLGRHYDADDFRSMVLTSVNSIEPYLTGKKEKPGGTLMQMETYKGKMGTGIIDAWKLLMQIEGTPFVTVKTGEESAINLREWFGDDAAYLTWGDAVADDEDIEALGLASGMRISDGMLHLTCNSVGCGKVTVHAVAGGTAAGTPTQTGGAEISRTISIVSRYNVSTSGGWL